MSRVEILTTQKLWKHLKNKFLIQIRYLSYILGVNIGFEPE